MTYVTRRAERYRYDGDPSEVVLFVSKEEAAHLECAYGPVAPYARTQDIARVLANALRVQS